MKDAVDGLGMGKKLENVLGILSGRILCHVIKSRYAGLLFSRIKDKSPAFSRSVKREIFRNGCFDDPGFTLAVRRNILQLQDKGQKKLLLDLGGISFSDIGTGIPRVAKNIAVELLKNSAEGYSVKAVYCDGRDYRYFKNFTLDKTCDLFLSGEGDLVDFKENDVLLCFSFGYSPAHKFLGHVGVKTYFVVYDILFLNMPSFSSEAAKEGLRKWFYGITHTATGLLCISKTGAGVVQEWIDANKKDLNRLPEVSWFYPGADFNSRKAIGKLPDNFPDMLDLIRSGLTFLVVGSLNPRKGQAQTLLAFEKLWEQGFNVNLVFVGKIDWHLESGLNALVDMLCQHSEFGKRFIWLNDVSDEYLEKIYEASTCLIFPSEGEGFGLPLIEAARHKLPIIARDIPVFREIARDHAFYFRGLAPDDIADAVKEWISLSSEGKAPTTHDMPWQSWSESAQQLLRAIGLE